MTPWQRGVTALGALAVVLLFLWPPWAWHAARELLPPEPAGMHFVLTPPQSRNRLWNVQIDYGRLLVAVAGVGLLTGALVLTLPTGPGKLIRRVISRTRTFKPGFSSTPAAGIVRCSKCRTKNRVVASRASSAVARCGSCGTPLIFADQ